MTETQVRPPGRPRSAQADEAIVDATIALLTEQGFDRLTMDAVAARAGVGKSTIYRRWPSKEALVVEAVARRSDPFPVEVSGTIHEQVTAILEGILTTSQTGVGRLLPCMVGASVTNPTLAAHYKKQIIEPRRARIAEILRDAIRYGELRHNLDIDAAIDAIVGPLVYRIVFKGDRELDRKDCKLLADTVINGLAKPPY